jgi:hypothetical protein
MGQEVWLMNPRSV